MLAGITYLLAIANINGTVVKLTNYAVKGVRGNVALLPIVLFLLALGLSSLGPGAITICALMAAPCMLLASPAKIPAFRMAVMVANGTQAGNMSPIAVAGVIFFKVDIGFFGFLIGSLLILLGAADEEKAFKAMPWGAIMMVTGETVQLARSSAGSCSPS